MGVFVTLLIDEQANLLYSADQSGVPEESSKEAYVMNLREIDMVRFCSRKKLSTTGVYPKPKVQEKLALDQIELEGQTQLCDLLSSLDQFLAGKVIVIFHSPRPLSTRTAEIMLEQIKNSFHNADRPLRVFLVKSKALQNETSTGKIAELIEDIKERAEEASYIFCVGGQESLDRVTHALVGELSILTNVKRFPRPLSPPVLGYGQMYRLIRGEDYIQTWKRRL